MSRDDWAKKIFIENASVCQPVLEKGLETASKQATGLSRIFRKYGAPTRNKQFRVLDVSCGVGRHAISLAKWGYQVVGFDPFPTFLRRATETLSLILPSVISVIQSLKERS